MMQDGQWEKNGMCVRVRVRKAITVSHEERSDGSHEVCVAKPVRMRNA